MRNQKNAIFFQDLQRKKTFFFYKFLTASAVTWLFSSLNWFLFRHTEIENKRIRRKNDGSGEGGVCEYIKGGTRRVVILWSKKGGYSLLEKFFLENSLGAYSIFNVAAFRKISSDIFVY